MQQGTCDIGLIGLAVMGQNLVLNMNDHGYTVAVFNRTVSKVDEFLDERGQGHARSSARTRSRSWSELLKRPRRVMMMVKAGEPVDEVIDALAAASGAGRHHHRRRQLALSPTPTAAPKYLAEQRACSSSAPASPAARKARVTARRSCPAAIPRRGRTSRRSSRRSPPRSTTATPCCDWVGENGAGHYVKMVHNGIEYGDMQLICEAYQLLKDGLGLNADEMHEVFAEWNKGELDSYLIEITRDIFGLQGRRRRAAGRQDPRHRRARRAPASGPASARSTSACR